MDNFNAMMLTEEEINILKETFYEQTFEMMDTLAQSAMDFERGSNRSDTIKTIKRIFHTLKGDSATVGLKAISQLVHRMEDLMGILENSTDEFDSDASDLILKVTDEITRVAKETRRGSAEAVSQFLKAQVDGFIEEITSHAPEKHDLTAQEKTLALTLTKEGRRLYRVKFIFSPECRMKGAGALILAQQLPKGGVVIKIGASLESPEIERIEAFDAVIASSMGMEELKRMYLIPGVIKDVNMEDFSIEGQGVAKKDSEIIVSAAAEAAEPGVLHKEGLRTIRVESEKIDQIMDYVGELVMGKSMIGRIIAEIESRYPREELVGRLLSINSFIERSLFDLQRSVMTVRMVPVGRVFKRFPRMVRDLIRANSKEIRLEMEGEDTEIDKALVDMVGEPLLHIIRNAVDHGIETVEERTVVGKPRYGTIRIEAYHQGSEIVVEVKDDGRGIDIEGIKARAIGLGLVSAEEAEKMGDREAIGFIYHSGFSTAAKVSDVSGRGIGMDIVKSVVESMRGTIRVDTERGQGTLFTLRFPLTLAIIRAIIFRIGSRLFSLPLTSVGEIIRVFEKDIEWVGGREVVRNRGRVLPLLCLHDTIGGNAKRQKKMFIMVINAGGAGDIGIIVDDLVGDDELVVKAIDKRMLNCEMISGASILGDGKIVLILNVFGLLTKSAGRNASGAKMARENRA